MLSCEKETFCKTRGNTQGLRLNRSRLSRLAIRSQQWVTLCPETLASVLGGLLAAVWWTDTPHEPNRRSFL